MVTDVKIKIWTTLNATPSKREEGAFGFVKKFTNTENVTVYTHFVKFH